jgi:DUF177 domain-containing protein
LYIWIGEAAVLITLRELELHRISVSKTYPPDVLDLQGSGFRQKGLVKVDAVAELVEREIRVRGHVSAQLETNCDRCLGRVEFPVESDFDLSYRPVEEIAREEEVEVPGDELKVGFYSGAGLALRDVVTEQVILAVPMKVVCRPGCLGLCPACGVNRNIEHCGCASEREDSPFTFLKKIK